jgi:DnaJ-domain-containing protein 1
MDCFALMDEPRRPWLDNDALKSRFLAISAEVHPDRFHSLPEPVRLEATRKYADLNTAYQTLREPRLRLQHLLEIERGHPPRDIQRIPPGTMDLFVAVGEACREVDAFVARREASASAMVKARLFPEGLDWTERLNHLQQDIRAKAAVLEEELRQLNETWTRAPAPGSRERADSLPLERLEEIYRGLSYVNRWTGQLQERLVRLAAD